MRLLIIIPMLGLLALCGCERQDNECQYNNDVYFLLDNVEMRNDPQLQPGVDVTIAATLVEMPLSGESRLFVLRDAEGNDYQFEPRYDIDWERQLDGLQLGRTYRFVFSVFGYIVGMKIFEGESLLYLAASYSYSVVWYAAFESSGLEGFTVSQLRDSKCKPDRREYGELVSLVTSLPVVFKYGNSQSVTLYPTQEAKFTTSQGEYVVHLLRSCHVDPQNYEDGGYYYSFYIKRLQE